MLAHMFTLPCQVKTTTTAVRCALQYDLLVVATMSLPPAPAVMGHREIMLGQRHLPALPHQRVALVVHNPDHLLVGLPLWLPGMLLSQAVRLGDVPAGPASVAGRAQHAAAGMQQRSARGGGSSRRLAAAPDTAPSGGREAAPPLPPRLQLLALSPNVATYTSSLVETWAGNVLGPSSQPRVPVPWLPPLVPWQSTAAEPAAAAANGQAAAAADAHTALVGLGAGGPNRPMRHLCIQGAIDPRRRDYDSFFEAASHPAVLAQVGVFVAGPPCWCFGLWGNSLGGRCGSGCVDWLAWQPAVECARECCTNGIASDSAAVLTPLLGSSLAVRQNLQPC